MSQKIERIQVSTSEFRAQKRTDDSDSLPELVGHAAVFDVEIEIRTFFGSFFEEIRKGAFKTSIERGDDVRALFNHDPDQVLGRTKSGTLDLKEDDIGLLSRISPPDTQLGRDIVELVSRGDIDQMSFGFYVRKEETEEREDGSFKRTILEADLVDVSPVTFPAYDMTDIGVEQNVRSAKEIHGDIIKHFERIHEGKKQVIEREQEIYRRKYEVDRSRMNLLLD